MNHHDADSAGVFPKKPQKSSIPRYHHHLISQPGDLGVFLVLADPRIHSLPHQHIDREEVIVRQVIHSGLKSL